MLAETVKRHRISEIFSSKNGPLSSSWTGDQSGRDSESVPEYFFGKHRWKCKKLHEWDCYARIQCGIYFANKCNNEDTIGLLPVINNKEIMGRPIVRCGPDLDTESCTISLIHGLVTASLSRRRF